MATVNVTEKALKEIKHIMADQNMDPAATFFRVRVVGGGCSGFQTKLDLDEHYDEKFDTMEDVGDGIKLVVDKRSALYISGATVDFHDALDKRGFTVDNPNATGRCGCGSSFSM
jgi:iron-sulfur cluster assembly accessory protein